MKIKKGDKVLIIRGKDRTKMGQVLKALPKDNKLIIEGLNLMTRHIKPRKSGEKGQKLSVPSPIHVSNVKIVCPKCKKATRIGFRKEKNKKTRICKKCNAVID
jgi:large subunit ribosomal protein L24